MKALALFICLAGLGLLAASVIASMISAYIYPVGCRPKVKPKIVQFHSGKFGVKGGWCMGWAYFYSRSGQSKYSDAFAIAHFCVGTKEEAIALRDELCAMPKKRVEYKVLYD